MTSGPFARVLIGYLPTGQGADARALGTDTRGRMQESPSCWCSVVSAVWIEHIGEQTGPAVVHGGERERAASALKEAAAELADVPGIGHVERRLEASSSPARGLHDTAVSERANLIVVGSSHHGPLGRVFYCARRRRAAAKSGALRRRGRAAQPGSAPVAPDQRDRGRVRRLTGVTDSAARRSRPGDSHRCPGASTDSDRAFRRDSGAVRPHAGSRTSGHDRARRGAPAPGACGEGRLRCRSARSWRTARRSSRWCCSGATWGPANLDVAGTGIDLLVLGSRAYGPARRTLVGSVSAAVIRHAPCAVLIMPRVSERSG